MTEKRREMSRKAKLLQSASYAQFVRLTPEQNVKLGFTPKARHYVLKGTKRLTKATPTISAREYEKKKAKELHGLTPEQATEARKHGAVDYVTAEQRERVSKAATTREETKIAKAVNAGEGGEILSNTPKPKTHGKYLHIRPGMGQWYRKMRRAKLAGETIPDGDWHAMIDLAKHYNDPKYAVLRSSPGAFNAAANDMDGMDDVA